MGIRSEVEFPVPEGVSWPKKIKTEAQRVIRKQTKEGRKSLLPGEPSVQESLGLSEVSWRIKRMPISMEFSWMTSLSMEL